jgi:hypothetical protein
MWMHAAPRRRSLSSTCARAEQGTHARAIGLAAARAICVRFAR